MRIGLLRDQQPFAEYVNNNWRVWYIFNNDVSSGTYFELQDHGIIDRVQVEDNEIIHILRVHTPTGAVSDVKSRQLTTSSDILEYVNLIEEQCREHDFVVGASM